MERARCLAVSPTKLDSPIARLDLEVAIEGWMRIPQPHKLQQPAYHGTPAVGACAAAEYASSLRWRLRGRGARSGYRASLAKRRGNVLAPCRLGVTSGHDR